MWRSYQYVAKRHVFWTFFYFYFFLSRRKPLKRKRSENERLAADWQGMLNADSRPSFKPALVKSESKLFTIIFIVFFFFFFHEVQQSGCLTFTFLGIFPQLYLHAYLILNKKMFSGWSGISGKRPRWAASTSQSSTGTNSSRTKVRLVRNGLFGLRNPNFKLKLSSDL